MVGKPIGEIGQLAFNFTGSAAGAGAPRFSIPIDTDNNGSWDTFAFISAFYCDNGFGLVDAINNAACRIFTYTEDFPSWAAMVAAHPDWKVADYFSFVIADEPGIWTVGNVKLGKAGK
jgi:hypothetical protein